MNFIRNRKQNAASVAFFHAANFRKRTAGNMAGGEPAIKRPFTSNAGKFLPSGILFPDFRLNVVQWYRFYTSAVRLGYEMKRSIFAFLTKKREIWKTNQSYLSIVLSEWRQYTLLFE